MALILIDDYKPRIVTPKVGAYLWMIKKGYVQPKEKSWRNYAERVKKIYLNSQNAPDDYLEERKDYLNREPEATRVFLNERWVPLVESRKDLI